MCLLYFRDKTIAPRDLLSPSKTLFSRVKLLRSAAYSYPPAPPFLTVYPHSAGIFLEIKKIPFLFSHLENCNTAVASGTLRLINRRVGRIENFPNLCVALSHTQRRKIRNYYFFVNFICKRIFTDNTLFDRFT